MKRLCILLCCVLLLLTACGKPASVPVTEAVIASSETVTEPAQTTTGSSESETSELPTQAQTEPVTTETQTQPPTEPAATTAASTTAAPTTASSARTTQTARETHTLFTTPQRTTGTRTTTAKATTTTTKKTPAATTTTRPTTTRPTTTSSGYVPSVKPATKTCTVTIDCRELRDRPEKLKTPEKQAFVPKSGYIVKDVTVEFKDGESVYDVLRRVCETHTCTDNCRFCQKDGCIQMESTYTPQFDNYYIEGIHQLYEKDCGGTSGWTYWVNGIFPNYGCSSYTVKPGDRIVWIYSIELDENETFD